MQHDFNPAPDETARARAALWAIPPDLPHDEWVRAGMAAHAAGLTFQDFDTWSAKAGPPLYNTADATSTWRSFDDKPGGIGVGTLYHMAKQHGWRDDGAGIPPQGKSPSKAPNRADKATDGAARAMAATTIWPGLLPVTPTESHPYIRRKQADGIDVANLRIVPATAPWLHLQNVAGYLAVPICRADGTLQSCQFIPPQEGDKLNLRFSKIAGGRHVVGEVRPNCPVYLVEGIGQAWAVWQATGHAAVCCFGWGNVHNVTHQLRRDNPGMALVLVLDVGKETAGLALAREVNAAVVCMPAEKPSNYDAWDYARDYGVTELERLLLEQAQLPPAPTTPETSASTEVEQVVETVEIPAPEGESPGLKLVSVCDVLTNPSPPPAFVWGQLLPRREVTLFSAHGETGKSTISLMLATAVLSGTPFLGLPTQKASVVVVSAEDNGEIVRHRLATVARERGLNPADWAGLHVVDITDSPELYESDGRGAGYPTATFTALRDFVAGSGAGLVVLDNASDSFGGDEIQRRQVRAFMRHLKKLAIDTGCALLLLSHVDKASARKGATGGESYSGSTAWHNCARSRLFLSRDGDYLKLEHQKSTHARRSEPLTLQWTGTLPELAGQGVDFSGLTAQAQGRNDDNAAAALLKLIAEFESREQFCSPVATARNNVHAMLRGESAFKALNLSQDDTRRIVNQCQRAGWIAPLEYKKSDRKPAQRWAVTESGRAFAASAASAAS